MLLVMMGCLMTVLRTVDKVQTNREIVAKFVIVPSVMDDYEGCHTLSNSDNFFNKYFAVGLNTYSGSTYSKKFFKKLLHRVLPSIFIGT